jgi:molecular chaperone DnaK (HSP70)
MKSQRGNCPRKNTLCQYQFNHFYDTVSKIDTYLLVGGSTRMLQVRDKLCTKYGLTFGENLIDPGADVDEMVAKGAALFGASSVAIKYATELINKYFPDGNANFAKLSEQEQEKIIEEVAEKMGESKENVRKKYVLEGKGFQPVFRTVASKSYGIRMLNDQGKPVVVNLIKKQSPVPVVESTIGGTRSPNATLLDLIVYLSNEATDEVEVPVDSNGEFIVEGSSVEKIGTAELFLDGNLPEGSPIEIMFSLNEQGQLKLKGTDKTHGKFVEAEFQSDGVMTEKEKQEAKAQSRDLVH